MSSHLRCGRLGFLWACLAVLCIVPPLAGETVLYNFAPPPKGFGPYGGVIRDSQGNLYGTALSGGSAGRGVVYKVDVAGHETVLHNFTGADGAFPIAGVIRDTAGNLYGTTSGGGSANAGVVYKVDAAGHETVLYSFTGRAEGGWPYAGVVRDSAGNLYGTTYGGGGSANAGVVYKVDAGGHETVLHTFTGQADGGYSYAGVVRDSAGNLYGTTLYGGSAGFGVVYKVDAASHETVLHSFTGGTDGSGPYAAVIRDSAGNLYGTTQFGGSGNAGAVYEVDATGHETVLYNFQGGAQGAGGYWPYAAVIRDSAGNLYGTTQFGGSAGLGVVYKVDVAGHETVLYSFAARANGDSPQAGVIRDSVGNLYGTTQYGGSAGHGVVYKVDAAGHETVLYHFITYADGSQPYAGVIRDTAGNLYGTTVYGGAAGFGVVYKVDAAGHETVLHSFTANADGIEPYATVVRDSAGNLYGTTLWGGSAGRGVVYKVDAAGHETVLYSFTNRADGGSPQAGVIRDTAGNLYGTTSGGGSANAGVVYKVDAAGHETVLYSFTGGADGGFPQAGVIRDAAGNFYGTTSEGGTKVSGVVFRIP
jgi:uncharacterized repeat protein (TIGR03803 family)